VNYKGNENQHKSMNLLKITLARFGTQSLSELRGHETIALLVAAVTKELRLAN
jgi:hypothetical protein